jgi:hypothetical protein
MRWWKRQNGQLEAQPDANAARDELLSAFLDDGLSPAESEALAADLAADATLRDALDGMREVKSMLGTLGEVRAPRSFALSAPPVAASTPSRRGLGRLELGTRIGAAVAAVAFMVVLSGDLRGGASDPAADEDAATSLASSSYSADDATRGGRQAEESASSAGSSGAAPATPVTVFPTSLSEPAPKSAPSGDSGTPTTLLAPQTDMPRAGLPDAGEGEGSDGQSIPPALPGAGADTAERPSTEATTEERLNEPQVDVDTPKDAATSAGGSENESAVDSIAPDAPVTDDAVAPAPPAMVPGSTGGLGGSTAASSGDVDAFRAPGFPTPEVVSPQQEWRVSVERSADLDVLLAAEVGLAMLAVVLGAGASWLWYQRRRTAAAG